MSRGLGRWQRILLHELYHNPKCDWLNGKPCTLFAYQQFSSESESVAVRRAAHSLAAKGYARLFHDRWAHTLYQVDPPPDITCPQCGRKCSELAPPLPNSEHLTEGENH
jgi:hypothetical protein